MHEDRKLYLVFEFLDVDLKKHMDSNPQLYRDPAVVKVGGRHWPARPTWHPLCWWHATCLRRLVFSPLCIAPVELQRFLYQMLQGIQYCHSHR